jgi:DNA invertase Pin-like site-specific DNA recombinase
MRKAIGIVRVSETKGRNGDGFASPSEQRERIESACHRDGLKLLRIEEELDVSGGTPLERRSGLRSAVEAVEAREASVVVAAYFDRLVRSLKVQGELVQRVEAAGGEVLAVDVGQVTEASAGQWLSGTMLGAVAEYHRRATAERTGEAVRRAVARGAAPWTAKGNPGYERSEDGRLVPNHEAPIVAEAFRMRADGATVGDVRRYLDENGMARTLSAVSKLLKSRTVLGEIHFGELVNIEAHEPIVDADTWRRAQRAVPQGTRPISQRLLARQGVLRCGSCGAKMVVGVQTKRGRPYPYYRCPALKSGGTPGDCPARVTITAELVEGIVVEQVQAALADVEGRASAEAHVQDAEHALERAQSALSAAIRAFDGLSDEPEARERLLELRQARDDAEAELDQLSGTHGTVSITAAGDWEELTLEERRALIRATVKLATVAPSTHRYGKQDRERARERITVELFGD